ncbi:MAG TPA: thiamine phosphate synthase [Pyrinomonadaceae bacterium]|nr:thiamine phosphate synthase [Pyrinomonadaceae bacterium]
MPPNLPQPIIYLITSGATTPSATPAAEDFQNVLRLVTSAVRAGVSLVQLREKRLTARALYELTARSADLVRGTETRLLVNDRADIARAAGADGVHLTTRSLQASIVRQTFGPDFLIGVSTHTPAEAGAAREQGADFAVFGPVFDTPSKRAYGRPVGLEPLREVAQKLSPFPLIALGGVTLDNAPSALDAGASGVAAIRLFADPEQLAQTVGTIRGRPRRV